MGAALARVDVFLVTAYHRRDRPVSESTTISDIRDAVSRARERARAEKGFFYVRLGVIREGFEPLEYDGPSPDTQAISTDDPDYQAGTISDLDDSEATLADDTVESVICEVTSVPGDNDAWAGIGLEDEIWSIKEVQDDGKGRTFNLDWKELKKALIMYNTVPQELR